MREERQARWRAVLRRHLSAARLRTDRLHRPRVARQLRRLYTSLRWQSPKKGPEIYWTQSFLSLCLCGGLFSVLRHRSRFQLHDFQWLPPAYRNHPHRGLGDILRDAATTVSSELSLEYQWPSRWKTEDIPREAVMLQLFYRLPQKLQRTPDSLYGNFSVRGLQERCLDAELQVERAGPHPASLIAPLWEFFERNASEPLLERPLGELLCRQLTAAAAAAAENPKPSTR